MNKNGKEKVYVKITKYDWKRVKKFKSGFYYIAIEAKVPIVMLSMDYMNKKTIISEPFYPTGNKKSDFDYIENFFDGVIGKVKEYSFYK